LLSLVALKKKKLLLLLLKLLRQPLLPLRLLLLLPLLKLLLLPLLKLLLLPLLPTLRRSNFSSAPIKKPAFGLAFLLSRDESMNKCYSISPWLSKHKGFNPKSA